MTHLAAPAVPLVERALGPLAVDVCDLRKDFAKRRRRRSVAALDGVTLAIARGECVAVLGQNGSGKSTLVRVLSTLLLPDAGSAASHAIRARPRPSSPKATTS